MKAYEDFQLRAEAAKFGLMEYLLKAKSNGQLVMGYGAAAKGNTLLNYAGIKPDLLPAVADRAPSKQGKLLPGSHIPVITPEELAEQKPHVLLVLPWNLIDEIRQQQPDLKLVTAVPSFDVGNESIAMTNKDLPLIPYTKPSITELEIQFVNDAVANGWGEHCYDYIFRFEKILKHI